MKQINNYLLSVAVIVVLSGAPLALGQKYQATPDTKLMVKISKSGLNRISNWPYQIMQVTGDDSTFRLKYDEDGGNVYSLLIG